MIDRVRGRVIDKSDGVLVIEVGGIGLAIYVPAPLAAELQIGEETVLYTHLHVRESELTLFGFRHLDERSLFRMLLNVSGVGPRVALNLLSAMSTIAIQRAILDEEPGLLSRVPGIGKKTAEKIILELKDKVEAPAGAPLGPSDLHDVDADVIEALIGLGYSVVEAQRAVQGLPPEVKDVSERLRLALMRLAA